MVGASRLSGPRTRGTPLDRRAGALLSTLLHAAATEGLRCSDVLSWIDRHNGAPALEILASTRRTRRLRPPICSPGSSPRTPVSSQGSGRPHRGCWPPIARRARSRRRAPPPLDLEAFCGGPNTLYICSTGRRQRQFAPLVVAIVGDVRDAAYVRARDGHAGPAHAPGARRGRQHRPHPRPPRHGQRGRRAGAPGARLPAGPLPGPRPLGRRQPTGSSPSSAPPWSCAGSRTPRPCGTSARWRATARSAPRRSAVRWTAGAASAPRRRSGTSRQPRLPVDAVAHGAPGRRSSSGRTRRSTRSGSRRPTSARPGASSGCRRCDELRRDRARRGRRPLSQRAEAELHRRGLAPPEPGAGRLQLALGADVVGEAVRRQRRQARPVPPRRAARRARRAPTAPGRRRRHGPRPARPRDPPGSTGRGPSARRRWFAGTTRRRCCSGSATPTGPRRYPAVDEAREAAGRSAVRGAPRRMR